ncbi:histidine phosphatase family protein [Paenibacillus spongiae]|uniref:Histidine phosphatase family protein n=1 Tax=Paenibacillus spongiae TaxID=2909671 RepID=A0ABY5S5G1_9BACL|nr:histidine phosphatase family protein [Paenibacillus spongiae]UVI29156.1 histidine phosphatase family protein [Paenibacillus spongiae]
MQGHRDSPLTELGKRQAAWLRASLKDIHFDAIYTSSSRRAIHTAEIIRGTRELDITPCDSFLEINLGSWEGQIRSDLERTCPDEHYSFWNTPHLYKPINGGESFAQLQDRIIPALHRMVSKHRGGNILLITHAVTLKAILAHYRGDPLDQLWTPPILQPTALSKVTLIDTEYTIDIYGDVSHYQSVRRAVGAIAYQGDKFVLVHKVKNTYEKESGVWDFPKGGLEEDESLEEAVLRELMEETGTDNYIIRQELPAKITFSFPEEIRKKIGYASQETTMFLVELIGRPDELKPCGKEIDEVILIESEHLLNQLSHQETVIYLEQYCRFLFNENQAHDPIV